MRKFQSNAIRNPFHSKNSFNIAPAESTVFRSDFRVPMTLCLRQSDAFTPPQIFSVHLSLHGRQVSTTSMLISCTALPGQSFESYLDTIRRTAELGAEHISSYALILAEGTLLFEAVRNGSIELPDEDAVADMEDAGFDLLRDFGYERYEISNFSLPGRECRHNLNYWANGDYLGLGLNAHSALHVNGKWVRFANKAELSGYNAALNDGKLPVEMTEEISRGDEMFECIMVGLRKIKGINRAEFTQRFGIDPVEHYASAVSDAVLAGNMEVTDDSMRLTQRGLDFQNEVLLNFM